MTNRPPSLPAVSSFGGFPTPATLELDVLKPWYSFIFRLFMPVRRVIRATRIRYDRQVVFGLRHHLRMRSSPKLHVLKPWLNSFIFCLRRSMFWG